VITNKALFSTVKLKKLKYTKVYFRKKRKCNQYVVVALLCGLPFEDGCNFLLKNKNNTLFGDFLEHKCINKPYSIFDRF